MMKAAVLAAGAVFGLANIASAQSFTVDFSGLGLADNATIPDNNGPATTNHQLDYTNALFWGNQPGPGFWYGQSGTTVNMSYAAGATTEWRVAIIADAGFEIVFDSYTVARAANSDLTDETNITVGGVGVVNPGNNQATSFSDTTHIFTRNFAAGSKPTGSTVNLFWTDGTGNDVAIDSFSFTVQAIPEPTVVAPLALAGAGLFLRRRPMA